MRTLRRLRISGAKGNVVSPPKPPPDQTPTPGGLEQWVASIGCEVVYTERWFHDNGAVWRCRLLHTQTIGSNAAEVYAEGYTKQEARTKLLAGLRGMPYIRVTNVCRGPNTTKGSILVGVPSDLS